MKKAVVLNLWALSVCGAVIAGIVIGRPKPSESVHLMSAPDVEQERTGRIDTGGLVAQLDELREGIEYKEHDIRALRQELAALKSGLRPGLSPELEKELREWLESPEKTDEEKARLERRNALRRKILQRGNKALREQGLAELMRLLQNTDPEEQIMGFNVLRELGNIKFDKEKFKPYVLAGLSDPNGSIRYGAFYCCEVVCPYEERLAIAARMIEDPHSDIRYWAAIELINSSSPENQRLAIPALRSFLEESDLVSKQNILYSLNNVPQEIDDVLIDLLGDEQLDGAMARLLNHRKKKISAAIVQRLAEMYDKGASDERIVRFLDPSRIHLGDPDDKNRRNDRPCLAEDARPIVRDIYLRIVRDSLSRNRRRHVLAALRALGDRWAIPELQEIARSPDAEGIEDELRRAIEHLQNPAIRQGE